MTQVERERTRLLDAQKFAADTKEDLLLLEDKYRKLLTERDTLAAGSKGLKQALEDRIDEIAQLS